ncbi:DUF1501 domain-containing protein [Viridibacterium curvum]
MTTNIQRRRFLKYAGATGAGAALLSQLDALAQLSTSEDYRALVCIFMFGGNDGNNLLVPYETSDYNRYAGIRSNLALPRDALQLIAPSNTGGIRYGLHPAMSGIKQLFDTGKAAVVANVGPLMVPTSKAQWNARSVPLPDNLFSHSDQQAQWQASLYQTPRSGWGGRLVERMVDGSTLNRGYSVVSVTGNNLWETSDSVLTPYKVSASGNFGFDFYDPKGSDPLSAAITATMSEKHDHLLEQGWLDVMARSIDVQAILTDALAGSALTTTFPDTGLGAQLRMVARLISARTRLGLKRQCFFCSIGGFDTHGEDQLQRQNELLGEISAAVSAFQTATTELSIANNVTLFTASDFGRTFTSNGQGSDHGWGSHHIIAGGAVQGGKLYGTFPTHQLNGPDDSGGNGNWIPTTSVETYAATLAKWFGASDAVLGEVFPRLGYFNADAGFFS